MPAIANPQANASPRLGVFEGRYTYSEIQVGSKTGESLLAYDNQTAQTVVIKRPSLHQPNPDVRRASIADLEREERALRVPTIAAHPAVCRLLEAGEAAEREGRYRYLVLEYAQGTPLPELIQHYHAQGQALPPQLYLNLFRQFLDLLATAHRAGVIYNDVKADHLFWNDVTGGLKVIDWGNAQFVSESASVSTTSDVFQCGELLYEFITGSRYVRPSRAEWEAADETNWQATFYQPVEAQLQQLVSNALHPNPRRRYQDAAEMAADLDIYCIQRDLHLPETNSDDPPFQSLTATPPEAGLLATGSLETPNEFIDLDTQLTQAIEAGESNIEVIRSLEVAALDAARTEADWQRAEYLKDLAEAYLALSAGQLAVAAHRLEQIADSARRDRAWDLLYHLLQLAQAAANGNEADTHQVCQALAALPETSAPSGRSLRFESIRAFSDLRAALELFRTQPEYAWPTLETLPMLFRSSVVEQVIACSQKLHNGLDQWREGQFEATLETLAASLVDIEQLPIFLGTHLQTAAGPVRRYQSAVHRSQEQLAQLLALVESRSFQLTVLDFPEVRKQLVEIVQHLPPQLGQLPSKSRPQIWLQTFDRVVAGIQRGSARPQTSLWLQTISPAEPVYPIFQALSSVPNRPTGSTSHRHRRRWQPSLMGRVLQHKALISVAVGSLLVAGLVLAGAVASLRPQAEATQPMVSGLSLTPVMPTQPSATSEPSPTVSAVAVACEQILAAEQAEDWQVIIEQSGLLLAQPEEPVTACGTEPLTQLQATAFYRLGWSAYRGGDYALAFQQWTSATELNPHTSPKLPLLLRCASVRANPEPVQYQALLGEFDVAQIESTCEFSLADYLTPTPAPAASTNVLAAMTKSHLELIATCSEVPCPTLYQDEVSQWHFGTFFEDIEGSLLLNSEFQQATTRQLWDSNLRGIMLEFSVFNPQPYSFPIGAEFGLQITLAPGRTVQLVLVGEPNHRASARLVGTDESAIRCNLQTPGPFVMRDEAGNFLPHRLNVRWVTDDTFQFELDGQPVCSEPFQLSGPPQVGLYFSGAGINMTIHQFQVMLVAP